MKITEEIRDAIINHLPKNYAKFIATRQKVSESTVYRVLHHEQENEEVAAALIELAAETRRQIQKKHERLRLKALQLSKKTAA